MKLFQTSTIIVALLAVLITVAGASAIQFRMSGVGSAPFASDSYGTFSVREHGVGGYGATWSPYGVAGGYSAHGTSFGFGYDYDRGMTAVGINSPGMRGTWARGFDGNSYGGFAAGSSFSYNAFGSGAFGNAWGAQSTYATYYSPYGTGWGTGYNAYRWM